MTSQAKQLAVAASTAQSRLLEFSYQPLPARVFIAYLRRSSDDNTHQVASLQRQREDMESYAAKTDGGIPIVEWFEDSRSGQTFDGRPGFMTMHRWCRFNRRSRVQPGYILLWEESRFGRPVIPGTTNTDHALYKKWVAEFELLGWILWPMDNPPVDFGIGDEIKRLVAADRNAQESKKIGERTTSGRNRLHRMGYWAQGYAPWPAVRKDAVTGQILRNALYDRAGKLIRAADRAAPEHRVLLARDPEDPTRVEHWETAARMLVQGADWATLQRYFDRHVPTARGKTSWSVTAIKYVMTNEALIGYIDRVVDHDGQVQRIKAMWDPLVNENLWHQVQTAVAARANDPRKTARNRARREGTGFTYLLTGLLHCAHCGLPYVGSPSNGQPYYRHSWTRGDGLSPEEIAKMHTAGCKCWAVQRDQVEVKLRRLLSRERRSPEYADTFRRLYGESNELEDVLRQHAAFAENRERLARKAVEKIRYVQLRCDESERQNYLCKWSAAQMELSDATAALAALQEQLRDARSNWNAVSGIMDETTQLDAIFERCDMEAVRRIVRWWVADIAISVRQVPALKKREAMVSQKTLHVSLNTAPSDPRIIVLRPAKRKSKEDHGVTLPGVSAWQGNP